MAVELDNEEAGADTEEEGRLTEAETSNELEIEEGPETEEGTTKGEGTTGMGSDGERKEGRREEPALYCVTLGDQDKYRKEWPENGHNCDFIASDTINFDHCTCILPSW
ncbi:hypothetical protein CMV_029184 [Castanea mollissima]|uniref:Uncharacterized protein n=1 Tax=Castanea mollissima TaxID=60419 RepID=A0A8J4QEX1_9ROSI|nr:hypothetical protein CMV_029184 [Castanea mollissima]